MRSRSRTFGDCMAVFYMKAKHYLTMTTSVTLLILDKCSYSVYKKNTKNKNIDLHNYRFLTGCTN